MLAWPSVVSCGVGSSPLTPLQPSAVTSQQCFPLKDTVWLNAVYHKTGTVFSFDFFNAVAGRNIHRRPWFPGAVEAEYLENIPPWKIYETTQCYQEESYVSAPCIKSMLDAGSAAMVASCAPLAHNASELHAQFAKSRRATGVSTRLFHFVRDPLEVVVSAYTYHKAASETWCAQKGNDVVTTLFDACRHTTGSHESAFYLGLWGCPLRPTVAPDAGACHAVLALLEDGTKVEELSYQDVLQRVDVQSGTLIQAWQHYEQQATMAKQYAAIEDLRASEYPSSEQAINVNLDGVMNDCKGGFTPVMRAAGLAADPPMFEACLKLACDVVARGANSTHSTSSHEFEGDADKIAQLKDMQRAWLPTTKWFATYQQPLRDQMGYFFNKKQSGKKQSGAAARWRDSLVLD